LSRSNRAARADKGSGSVLGGMVAIVLFTSGFGLALTHLLAVESAVPARNASSLESQDAEREMQLLFEGSGLLERGRSSILDPARYDALREHGREPGSRLAVRPLEPGTFRPDLATLSVGYIASGGPEGESEKDALARLLPRFDPRSKGLLSEGDVFPDDAQTLARDLGPRLLGFFRIEDASASPGAGFTTLDGSALAARGFRAPIEGARAAHVPAGLRSDVRAVVGPFATAPLSVLTFAEQVDGAATRLARAPWTGVCLPQSPSSLLTPPATPTGLQGASGDQTASLSWNAASGATAYRVYRDGALVAATPLRTHIDTPLVNGVSYAYQVSATNAVGESPKSAPVVVVPLPPLPAKPATPNAIPGDRRVDLAWSPVASATSYRVLRDGGLVATTTSAAHADVGLTNGVAYRYEVAAVNLAGAGPASNSVTATPVAPAPGAPANLAATAGDARVDLAWSPVAGAVAYRVYRDGALAVATSLVAHGDADLENGRTYAYAVSATNAWGLEGPRSATVTATPLPPVPAQPSNLAASARDGGLALSWDPALRAVTYVVYRDGVRLAEVAVPRHDDAVAPGSLHRYAVSGKNLAGEGPRSAEIEARARFAAPANLQGVAGDARATLSWNPVEGATTYRVSRDGVVHAVTAGPFFSEAPLENGRAYAYRVSAMAGATPGDETPALVLTPASPCLPTPQPEAEVVEPKDHATVEASCDGGLSWIPLATAPSRPVRTVATPPDAWTAREMPLAGLRCVEAAAGGLLIGFRWVSDAVDDGNRGWAIDDVAVRAGPDQGVWGFERGVYDVVIAGSHARHAALDHAGLPASFAAFAGTGGRVVVLGSDHAAGAWLSGLVAASARDRVPATISLARTHALAAFPHPLFASLPWPLAAKAWDVDGAPDADRVAVEGDATLLAVANRAVILSAVVPGSFSASEQAAWWENVLTHGRYRSPWLDEGSAVPPGVAVASARRLLVLDVALEGPPTPILVEAIVTRW